MEKEPQKDELSICINSIIKNYVTVGDEEDDDLISCIQSIVQSPQQYQQSLIECFGKKQSKEVISKFKQNKEFQKLLNSASQKLIHKVISSSLKIGQNKNFLYYLAFYSKDWNLTKIAQQIQDSQKKLIKQSMVASSSPDKFFSLIDTYLIDFLNRRLDISEFVSLINQEASKNKQLQGQFKKMLNNLTPMDLVVIVSKMITHKADFGALMHNIGFPIPLIFKVPSSEGAIQYFQPNLLERILRTKDFNIVTSFGSNEVVGKGKTMYMKELYYLKQKYLNTQISQFHDGSVDLYTSVPIQHRERSLIVADFQGDWKTQLDQYRSILKKLILNSYAVYFHLTQRQFNSKTFMKQFDQKLLSQLINSKGKVFLLIRDSDNEQQIRIYKDIEAITIPNISKKIPPQLILRNQYIFKKLNQTKIITPKIELSIFSPQNKSKLFSDNSLKVQKIIDILNSHQNRLTFYEVMFPQLHNLYKISLRQKDKIIREYQRDRNLQDDEFLASIRQAKYQIEKLKLIQFKASKFVELVIKGLSQNFSLIDVLSEGLALWRNKATQIIQNDILSKKATLQAIDGKQQSNDEVKQKLCQQIKQLQQKMETYDVSIDTIFSQIISLQKANQNPQVQALIQNYYSNLYRNVTPINIIQGKTLTFGNKYLQSMFQALNANQYKDKQIFVVSVIGAQSSAKSTLMNYLFKCNFATSAGRCTKGVYFTIVQCNQKVIVVVDTEGILSVSARNNIFDVQIASFVMLISDLVIINNKGQLNTVLRDLMGVCIYAVHELNKNESKQIYKPNQIFFSLRDQTDDGVNQQKKMLSDIITHLKSNSKIQHQLYMTFTDEDIFPLQSAFMKQNIGLVCVNQANNGFGKSILTLRSKIVDKLKTPKSKNILQFYKSSEDKWKAIVDCGKNIFNFKCMLQIQVKEQMQVVLTKLKLEDQTQIRKQQQIILQIYNQNLSQNQEQINSELKILFQKGKQQLKDKFKSSFDSHIQMAWVQSFFPDIDVFYKKLYNIFVDRIRENIVQAKQNQQKNTFKQIITGQLKELYQNDKDIAQIKQKIKLKSNNLLLTIKEEIESLKKQKQNLGENKKSFDIKRICKEELDKFFLQQDKSGFTITSLKQDYNQMDYIYSRNEINGKLVKFFGSFDFIGKNSDAKCYEAFAKYIKISKQSIQQSVLKNDFTTLDKVNPMIQEAISLLKIPYQQIKKKIQQITTSVYKAGFGFSKSRQRMIGMFIASLPQIIQLQLINNCIQKNQIQMATRQSIVDQRLRQVDLSFQARDNNQKAADQWIKKCIDLIIERHYKKSLENTKQSLDNVNANLSPQKMIQKALNQSIDSPDRTSKDRLIRCYKVITNINKFIKQLLYQVPQIKDLQERIDLERTIMVKLTIEDIQKLKNIIHEAKQNHSPQKNLKYYSQYFKINLQFYKPSDFQKNLANILVLMDKKINLGQTTYINISIKQIQARRRNLQLQSKKYLKEKIQPSVIGCQARCPYCGMKCKKSSMHTDGHQVANGTHVLSCFIGFCDKSSNIRLKSLCYTESTIKKQKVYHNGNYYSFLDWIIKYHPLWLNHFKSGTFESVERRAECEFIWKNIGDMLIKYGMFDEDVINDSKDGEYALTDKDIKKYNLELYYQDK